MDAPHVQPGRGSMTPDFRRRQLVFASAGAAALAPLGFAPRAFAQSNRLADVPTVDTLTIRVLTDSSYDTPRVGSSKWVKTRRAGLVSRADWRKTLHNEWGLALAIETKRGAETRNLLGRKRTDLRLRKAAHRCGG